MTGNDSKINNYTAAVGSDGSVAITPRDIKTTIWLKQKNGVF
jgi:hypothetical protein